MHAVDQNALNIDRPEEGNNATVEQLVLLAFAARAYHPLHVYK